MTKDLKFVPVAPKTYTVLELRDQQQPIKKSPLSVAARNKVINRSGSNYLSESKEYGPCSYSGCPYPSVPFNISISIDGLSRNWGCWPHVVSYFPGNWTYSSHMLGDYYWKTTLCLENTEQARDAIRLMNSENLHVVNATGFFCVENGKFCKNAKNIINECISHHERGNEIYESKTIDSDLHKWAKWGFKAAAASVVTAVAGPAAPLAGSTIWAASRVAQNVCEDGGAAQSFWKFSGDMSGDVALGSLGGKLFGETVGKTVDLVKSGTEFSYHEIHKANGSSYDSTCPICNI